MRSYDAFQFAFVGLFYLMLRRRYSGLLLVICVYFAISFPFRNGHPELNEACSTSVLVLRMPFVCCSVLALFMTYL